MSIHMRLRLEVQVHFLANKNHKRMLGNCVLQEKRKTWKNTEIWKEKTRKNWGKKGKSRVSEKCGKNKQR